MDGPAVPAVATGRAALRACLDEYAALSYAQADANSRDAEVQQHIELCPRCRVLVSEAARTSGSALSEDAGTWQRTLGEGDRLCDRYRVIRFIARGGMGEVYEAEDELIQVRVAIKTLVATAVETPSAFSRLRAEVVLARTVLHRNVCRLMSLEMHEGRHDGRLARVPFIVMELLEGETLTTLLRRQGPMSTDRALPLVRQMIAGLAAIHAAAILHRDFKSDNVMLVSDGDATRLVVTDFGLARPLLIEGSRSFSANAAVGTIDYMAPEQALGRPLTAAADVYSLGVVLFEMLTGARPFSGANPVDVAMQRASRPAPRLSQVRPGVGATWDVLIAKCLERDPEHRWQSIAAAEGALESAGSRRSPPRARRMMVATTVVAVIAAAAVMGVAALRARIATNASGTSAAVNASPDAATVLSTTDWEPISRGAFELPGRVYCLEPLDDHRVGMIWGDPRRAEVLDLRSGDREPWILPSNALLSGVSFGLALPVHCPRLSPDGSALAYEGLTDDGRRGVFVADNGGSAARFLTLGGRPTWDRYGRALAFVWDDVRAGIAYPSSGGTSLTNGLMIGAAAYTTGAIFDQDDRWLASTTRDSITVVDRNTMTEVGRIALGRQGAPGLIDAANPRFKVLSWNDAGHLVFLELNAAHHTRTRAVFGTDGDLWAVARQPSDAMVVAGGWDHPTVRTVMGEVQRTVPVGGPVYFLDANSQGDVVIQTYRDQATTLELYPRRGPAVRVASGPAACPSFTSDGNAIVLIQQLGEADVIVKCSLGGICTNLAHGRSVDHPALSPSERHILYIDWSQAQAAKLVDVATQVTTSLTEGLAFCAPRWLDDRHVWIATPSEWKEFDVTTAKSTGRTVGIRADCEPVSDGPDKVLAPHAIIEHHYTSRVFVRPATP